MLVAVLNLPSWCRMMVERLFLAVPWGCLRFVIVVIPDHTHLLFFLLYPVHAIRQCLEKGLFSKVTSFSRVNE